MKNSLGAHGRRLPRYRPGHHEEHEAQLRRVIPDETTTTTASTMTAGGDKRQLRGIPVVGATGGAVPGTNPLEAILDKESSKRLAC